MTDYMQKVAERLLGLFEVRGGEAVLSGHSELYPEYADGLRDVACKIDGERGFVEDEMHTVLDEIAFSGEEFGEDQVYECEPDCYYSDLRKWFSADPAHQEWVEEAIREFGMPQGKTLDDMMALGQVMLKERIRRATYEFVKEMAEELECEEEE